MKKTLTIIVTIILAIIYCPTILNAQACVTCPGNTVTGSSASALGINNTVSGTMSTAIGNNNNISSFSSIVIGSYSNVYTGNSTIIGGGSTINNGCSESYIFGNGSVIGNSNCMLIGHRLQSAAGSQIILGSGPGGGFLTSNKMHSLAVGFLSTVPTFFVGESPSSVRTGKVSIGNTTDPQAKLHIRADAAEDATMLLEATGTNKISSFMMGGGQAVIGTTSNNNSLSFVTGSNITRMFINAANGNIGIGSGDPVAKLQVKDGDIFIEDINRGIIMKSPDGNCWRGVLNNQGQLEFVLLPDCVSVSASSQIPVQNPGFRIAPNPASGSLQIQCNADDMDKFNSFKMLDASGHEIKAGKLIKTHIQLDIHNLSAGIYFIHFYGKEALWTEKVVIQ